jgi:dihydroxyacetone kinase
MRRFDAFLALVLASGALAGCAATPQTSARGFKGDEKAVAQVVDDLQSAGQRKQPDKICSDVLAAKLVDQLKAGGTNCVDEMDKAITDSDDFDLKVTDVTVTGSTASAKVRQGKDGPTATWQFAKERNGWRATSLG